MTEQKCLCLWGLRAICSEQQREAEMKRSEETPEADWAGDEEAPTNPSWEHLGRCLLPMVGGYLWRR